MVSNEIVISEWRPVRKGALLGTFTLNLPSGLVLKNCSAFTANGKRWVSGPTQTYPGKDGKLAYFQLLGFTTRATQDAFNADVLEALDQYLGVPA